MRSSLTASFSLHIAAILLATFGLPSLMKPPEPIEDVPVIPVELVTLSDTTNVITKPREAAPEPPKPEVKPEPAPAPKPVETPPPQKSEPPPPAPQAVAPPEPKPEVKPEPKPEPKKEEPKPQAQPQPESKPTKKPKAPEDFDSLLKNLAKNLPQPKAEPKAAPKAEAKNTFDDMMKNAITSNKKTVGDPDKPLTMTEHDMIANIFNNAMARCWNAPIGAKDAKDIVVNVRISLNEDGSLRGIPQVVDSVVGKSETWRIAAESTVRALRSCSPYTELPKNLYSSWNDTVLRFPLGVLLGG